MNGDFLVLRTHVSVDVQHCGESLLCWWDYFSTGSSLSVFQGRKARDQKVFPSWGVWVSVSKFCVGLDA